MLDYVRSILSLFFAISLMYVMLDCEIKLKKNRYLMCIYIVVILSLDGLVLVYYGYPFLMKWYPLFVHLPVFLGFIFISKFTIPQVFFVLCTLIAVSTSFSMVGLTIAFFLDYSRDFANIVCYILYLPVWILIYKFVRPHFIYMLNTTDKSWLGFSMIPISYSALLYSIGEFNMDEVISKFSVKYGVLLFVLVFFAYFLILRFFKQSKEQHILQEKDNVLRSEIAAAKLHFKALEDSREETLLCRHDIRHHLNLINSFLVDNNSEGARKYIDEIRTSVEDATVEEYCENYVVNLILYSYITEAKKERIAVETHINLPEDNAVTDMDLCVLFSNMVENATNACRKISNTHDRFIKIICKNKSGKLLIQITNSYEGIVEFQDNLPVSTLESHGIGTKSLVSISQKYGGIYSFTAENKIFTASIIL